MPTAGRFANGAARRLGGAGNHTLVCDIVRGVTASASLELVPASSFSFDELARAFTASFAGYVIPMNVDEPAFRRMVGLFDVDLDASRVAVRGDEPVGLVNVGLRGAAAWIGGMGVVAAERRAGVGEMLMRAAHEAAAVRGAAEVWLEVIATNAPAIRLYEKLGYERVRELEIWTVEPDGAPPSSAREVPVGEAHARVRALRRAPEPWQRSDETLERLRASETLLGLVADGAAAVIRPTDGGTVVEQVAAESVDSAADVLAAVLARGATLRLTNIPAADDVALALARFGGAPALVQHELRLGLA